MKIQKVYDIMIERFIMKTNLKVIKFTTILSLILFIITFLICLNISFEWFDIKWMSNNFLLVVFSGAFASILVVLVCEVQKYLINKHDTEDKMFDCCLEILARFVSAKTSLIQAKQTKQQLSDGLLSALHQYGQHHMNIFLKIDYSTFCKKNKLFISKEKYISELVNKVEPALRDCLFLDIAINESRIQNLQSYKTADPVFAEGNVLGVINILINKFEECIMATAEFLQEIDYSGRFKFKERFSSVQNSKNFFDIESVEEFINRNH